MLASCGQDVKIHSWPDGKFTGGAVIPGNSIADLFQSISWSNSGKMLLAVSAHQKPIVLLKATDVEGVATFETDVLNMEEANVGAFLRSSENTAAFGYQTGDVKVLDVFTGELVRTYSKLPSSVLFLQYDCEDTLLAAGCSSGNIFLYDAAGNVSASFCVPASKSVSAVAFHPFRDNLLAGCSKEGVAAIWDVRTSTITFSAKDHTGTITGIAISTIDEVIATVGIDKTVNAYDLRSKEPIFSKIFPTELTAITCATGSEELAVGTSEGKIFNVDWRYSNAIVGSFSAQQGPIRSILFDTGNSYYSNENSRSSLIDDVASSEQILSTSSDSMPQATEEFSFQDEKLTVLTVPVDMDHLPAYQLIEASKLLQLKSDILVANRELMVKFVEEMTADFLQFRFVISRKLRLLEVSHNKCWQELNKLLFKLSELIKAKSTGVPQQVSEEPKHSSHSQTKLA